MYSINHDHIIDSIQETIRAIPVKRHVNKIQKTSKWHFVSDSPTCLQDDLLNFHKVSYVSLSVVTI